MARNGNRTLGGKPDGKIGSRQFPNEQTESLFSVKSCVRQLTVLPRKIGKHLPIPVIYPADGQYETPKRFRTESRQRSHGFL
jgi:hypothetical protein